MRDLFPNKRFNYTKINGIEYISKDILEMLINQAKQEMREECINLIKDLKYNSNDLLEYKKRIKQKLEELK